MKMGKMGKTHARVHLASPRQPATHYPTCVSVCGSWEITCNAVGVAVVAAARCKVGVLRWPMAALCKRDGCMSALARNKFPIRITVQGKFPSGKQHAHF